MGQLNLKVPIILLNDFLETLICFKYFIMYQNFVIIIVITVIIVI